MQEQQSLFKPKEPRMYGMLGYESEQVQTAIRLDRVDMMRECVKRDWVDANCEMLYGGTLLAHCERNAPNCAKYLRSTLSVAA